MRTMGIRRHRVACGYSQASCGLWVFAGIVWPVGIVAALVYWVRWLWVTAK